MAVKFEDCYQVKEEDGHSVGYVEKQFGQWVFVPENWSIQMLSEQTLSEISTFIKSLNF